MQRNPPNYTPHPVLPADHPLTVATDNLTKLLDQTIAKHGQDNPIVIIPALERLLSINIVATTYLEQAKWTDVRGEALHRYRRSLNLARQQIEAAAKMETPAND